MSGEHWSDKKTGVGDNSTITVTYTATIPTGASISVTLFEDVGNDGTGANTDEKGNSYDNSNTQTLSAGVDNTVDFTGFDGGGSTNNYWGHFEFNGDGVDPTLPPSNVGRFYIETSSGGQVSGSVHSTIDGVLLTDSGTIMTE